MFPNGAAMLMWRRVLSGSRSHSQMKKLFKQNLINYVAPNEPDLFKQISAQPVKRFDGQLATLQLVNVPVRIYDMT